MITPINKPNLKEQRMSATKLPQMIDQIGQIILGKPVQIQQIITCVLAQGHILIEDVPGVGKTTLAHVLAKALGLSFQRIQFTSDLLPADILGVSIYDQSNAQFKFHQGAIFTQLLLADEINRATPKTQSALLEAMEEQQVTIEGETYPLPRPFIVIATQNPSEQIGTFPLPESQLDRFTMRIRLGYPDSSAERQLLQGKDRKSLISSLQSLLSIEQLQALQTQVPKQTVSETLLDYIQALLQYSRESGHYRHGLSPRAGLTLLHSAQAWALLQQRDYVIPEDVQAILEPVAGHRLNAIEDTQPSSELIRHLIEAVPVPL